MNKFHTPVMLNQTITLLNILPNHWYIDCNLGGSGHTNAILELGAKVLGIDQDKDSTEGVARNHHLGIQESEGYHIAKSPNLIIVESNFSQIQEIARAFLNEPVSGILFDLGLSSHQLETPSRGFSFKQDAELDMRMNQNSSVSAKDLVNGLSEKELSILFWKYGQERFAKRIAKKIVEVRKPSPITSTNQLAQIITSIRPNSSKNRTHPATRVFQALRIAVNDELNTLKDTLPKAFEILPSRGRLVIISFHSLEDRIVKDFFSEKVKENRALALTKKPITPTDQETSKNPRSRSGKLRAIEKI